MSSTGSCNNRFVRPSGPYALVGLLVAAALPRTAEALDTAPNLERCVELHDRVELDLARAVCAEVGRSTEIPATERAKANAYWAHAVSVHATSERNGMTVSRMREEIRFALTAAFCDAPALMRIEPSGTDDRFAKHLSSWLREPESGFESMFVLAQRDAETRCPRWTDAIDGVVIGGAAVAVAFSIAAAVFWAQAEAHHASAQDEIHRAARGGTPLDLARVVDVQGDARSSGDRANLTLAATAGTLALTSGYLIWRLVSSSGPPVMSIEQPRVGVTSQPLGLTVSIGAAW